MVVDLHSYLQNVRKKTMNLTKRTKILVDPKVQWAIGRRVMLHWLMFGTSLVLINVLIGTIISLADESFAESLTTAIRSQFPVAFILAVMLPMFLYDTLKLTNRFAGPMFRLRNALRTLPTGAQKSPLAFRKGDFWPEAAVEFNSVAVHHEMLRGRNAELEMELRKLRQTLELQTV